MKKITITLFSTILFFSISLAQVSEGGQPYSFHAPELVKAQIEMFSEVQLNAPELTPILAEDIQNNSKDIPYRVGINLPVQISPETHGTWTEIPGYGNFWKLKIKVSGAMALALYFQDAVKIPEGARLYVYSSNKKQVLGGYTHRTDNFEALEMVAGEEMIIEYFAPENVSSTPKFNIKEVVYFYRGVEDHIAPFQEDTAEERSSRADPCQVDVACTPESTGWQDEINSVVHYTFPSGNDTFVCSSSTINNTSQDCTPYILSAWHCGEPSAGSSLGSYVWYWNYQKSTCQPSSNGSNPSKGSQTMTGGIVRASSENGTLNNPPGPNQVAGSDFFLLELNSNIPNTYNAYFAGWNRTNTAASSGVSIHHPAGSAKKISTYTGSLSSVSYNGGASNAHWLVYWASTANGHGVTEGGSSGSPIFNQNGQIVGQLSGGSSFCNQTNQPDLYGKMFTNWDLNGTTNNARLKPWLDPANTGVNSISGTYNPCTPVAPIANFSANQTNVNTGATVSFSDLSSGAPTSWSWTISPATGWSFTGGTNANSQNPQVQFTTAGTYTVSLTASNAQGNDTETKNNYITVTDGGTGGCENVQTSAYTMGFETGEDLSEWAVYNLNGDQNGNGDNITWGITTETAFTNNSIPMTARTGDRLAYYFFNASQAANDWLVTPCFELEPGYDYTLSFWYRVALEAYPEKMKVQIGGTQNPSGMSTTLVDLGAVDNEAYAQSTITFTVTTAGDYYIGFHCYSDADQYVLGLDDINLTSQSNGSGGNVTVDTFDDWQNSIGIYPNPTKGTFKIDLLNSNVKVQKIDVLDMSGKLIKSINGKQQKQYSMNLQSESEGVYMIKITTEKGVIVKKITKY